jgi:hypothetical protein
MDFSCEEADFESTSIKIESPDRIQPHIFEVGAEPPVQFYDMHGFLTEPVTLVNRTWYTKPFDLSSDCPFIDSAGYYNDISAMHLSIPTSDCMDSIGVMPAPPSRPATIVASMAQCRCSRVRYLLGCKVCSNGDVDMLTLPTTAISDVQPVKREQPQHSIAGSLEGGNMDVVDQYTNIHCQDEVDDELTLSYPSDDEDDLSLLLAPYQGNMEYRVSSLRSSLPRTKNPSLYQQPSSGISYSTSVDDFDWPRTPSQYIYIRS